MNININDNFEEYHEDFVKGLNKRETLYVGIIIIVGAAVYLTAFLVFKMPSIICTYAVIPFVIPFALAGFYKIRGMTVPEWLRRRRELNSIDHYTYKGIYGLPDDMAHGNEMNAAKKNKDKEELYMESLDVS